MFENIMNFFKKLSKKEKSTSNSKDTAKERLHLVLMQDRANVSADFLDLMRQEIIDVIKKYIEVDESAIDVRLTNKENEDGTNGAPALYANIPILNIKEDARKEKAEKEKAENESSEKNEEQINNGLENETIKQQNEESSENGANNLSNYSINTDEIANNNEIIEEQVIENNTVEQTTTIEESANESKENTEIKEEAEVNHKENENAN